jgi:hypothetical protein
MTDIGLDTDLGERFYEGSKATEERYIQEIIASIKVAIDRHVAKGEIARRDAHAFDNGLLRATFKVDPGLDSKLAQGVFGSAREYPVWIRVSNGNTVDKSRWFPDARAFAIKLMDVPGPKLAEDEKFTQDFILISHPTFFVENLERYKLTLIEFLKGGIFDQYVRATFKLRGREIVKAFASNLKWITNPLLLQYWSMTPYRLGTGLNRTAVKYLAVSRAVKPPFFTQLATFLRKDFTLKGEMSKTLSQTSVVFDFYIQRYVDERTPVEDSMVEWRESVSRPEHVATITIDKQDIMSPERAKFCENLSFNPWHSLAEHRPLGTVNRVRRGVYLAISRYRREKNGVTPVEPTGAEKF